MPAERMEAVANGLFAHTGSVGQFFGAGMVSQ